MDSMFFRRIFQCAKTADKIGRRRNITLEIKKHTKHEHNHKPKAWTQIRTPEKYPSWKKTSSHEPLINSFIAYNIGKYDSIVENKDS
jgi:hypothetical protein